MRWVSWNKAYSQLKNMPWRCREVWRCSCSSWANRFSGPQEDLNAVMKRNPPPLQGSFLNWSTFISISLHQLHCAYVLTAITKIRGASPIGQQCDTCSNVWSLYEVGHWFRLDRYGHVSILSGHKMVSTAYLRISSGQVCAVLYSIPGPPST